jgi:Putative restriction endonuclease
LSREEFHRRYEAMPQLQKAELIEGVVFLQSPARLRRSGKARTELVAWLGMYSAYTPGTEGSMNPTVLLDPHSEPQPDTLLMLAFACGGNVRINHDGFIEGAPELIADANEEGINAKLNAYQSSGVKEYVVWRVEDRDIDWFVLRRENRERMSPSEDGLLKSVAFPGLWLDSQALIAGNLRRVFEVVQMGLRTGEHAEFVRRLELARGQKQP